MADITVVERVDELWVKASQLQKDFLMLCRLYPNDNQICNAMLPPISHCTPIQWRKRDGNFVKLESLFHSVPIETALMYLYDQLGEAVVILHRAMRGEKITRIQFEAAKTIPKLMMDAEVLRLAKKKSGKLEVKWKDKYDDGEPVTDNPTVLALPSAADNNSVSG